MEARLMPPCTSSFSLVGLVGVFSLLLGSSGCGSNSSPGTLDSGAVINPPEVLSRCRDVRSEHFLDDGGIDLPILSSASLGLSVDGAGGLAAADFNRDGVTDLAVGGYSSGSAFDFKSLVLFQGTGDGGFERVEQSLNLGGVYYSKLIAHDFDADGQRDLAGLEYNTSSVTVLRGTPDAGFVFVSKSAPVPYAGGDDLLIADYNGDAFADVAITANAWEAHVGLGNSDAGFDFGAPKVIDRSGPEAVAGGDFDSDGHEDLVIGIGGDRRLHVLLGDGTGTFPVHRELTTSDWTYSLATVDLDGDGNLDVLNGTGRRGVEVLLGNGRSGFPFVCNTDGFAATGLVAADFDGDGRVEVAAIDYWGMRILVLEWTGKELAIVGAHPLAESPTVIEVGELNGDGRLDLAVSSGRADAVWIFLDVGR